MVTGTSIAFAPALPWAILAPLLGLAALVLLLAIVRRAGGVWWRGLGLLALALALLNPSLVREERQPVKDIAVVVVDQSPSQAIGDRQARTERALQDLLDRFARFEEDLEVRVVRSGQDDSDAQGMSETRLFDILERTTADVPRRRMAGAVLITDGQVHDVPQASQDFDGLGPVHTLLTGERDETDRRLALVQAPSYGIVGRPIRFTVRVDDMPGGTATDVMLSVRQDGEVRRSIRLPVGVDQTLEFTLTHGGQNVFELEVETAGQELTLANNRVAVVVNGVRDRLRVLLVSGEPHAGERTWRNLLKADPAVDLVHFTILRPPEKQDGTPIRELSLIAFPIRELFEIKLEEFDLIIFDRYRRRGVLPPIYLENIAEFVKNGGALLEASGPTFATPLSLFRTPLGTVLPGEPTGDVIERPFRPTVTDLGRRHPVTAMLNGDTGTGAPNWGRWFRQIDVTSVDGSVLMAGADDRPLLILNRVGEGRVAQLTSDHMWLWSRGYDGGGPQAELLRRLAHWLMKEPELEENDLRARVDGNRITIERRSLEPDPRSVEVVSPSDRSETVTLPESESGVSTAVVTADEPGIYRISDGERTAFAVVGAVNPPELRDVRTTEDPLRPIAAATGGGIHWIADRDAGIEVRRVRADRDQSGRDWIGLRANGDYVVTGIAEVPLLPAILVLFLALGGLMLAWRREGR